LTALNHGAVSKQIFIEIILKILTTEEPVPVAAMFKTAQLGILNIIKLVSGYLQGQIMIHGIQQNKQMTSV